ncbi:hypothetical protein CDD83_11089 [Cordyceps sp. RAO-2017]|nr:hypothetical protein CDD83_11089 [Cordyceps sp. RAO-2017]
MMASITGAPAKADERAYVDGRDQASDTSNGLHQKGHQSTVSHVRDAHLFKLANPGPLGLFGFALTTFVVGLYECGAGLPDSNPLGAVGPNQAVVGLALFYGGLAQFVAGIMEFRVGNTFGTALHCSYSAFWLAFAPFLIPAFGIRQAYRGDERAYSVALGIFLILWCFLTLVFFVAALRTNLVVLLVLGLLAAAYFLLAVAQFVSTTDAAAAARTNRAGGVFAVLSALAGFYAGSAGLMTEDTTWVRLPLGELAYAPRQRRGASSV